MARKKKPDKSRNKPRKTVNLNPRIRQQLRELARLESRKLIVVIERILMEALEAEGLWPPPEDQAPQ